MKGFIAFVIVLCVFAGAAAFGMIGYAAPKLEASYNAMSAQARGTVEAEEAIAMMYLARATGTAGASTAQAEFAQATVAAQATQIAWQRAEWTAEAQRQAAQATAAAQQATAQAVASREAFVAQTTAHAFHVQQTQDAMSANASATSVASGLYAMATVDAANAALADQAARRGEQANKWMAGIQVASMPVGAIVSILFVMWLLRFAANHRQIGRDDRGAPPVIIHNGRLVNPDINPYPAYQISGGPRLALPVELQARSIEAQLRIIAARSADPRSNHYPDMVGGLMTAEPSQVQALPGGETGNRWPQPPATIRRTTAETESGIAVADWSLFANYQGIELPVGVQPDGSLMLAHPEVDPHRTMAGKTGAGKSRYGMRPLIAGALARGSFVVNLGELSPTDFKIFASQPNYADIVCKEDPIELLPYVTGALAEMRRRADLMYSVDASRWSDLPAAKRGPDILLVIDEFAALADTMDSAAKKQWTSALIKIGRLGRKFAIRLALGAQNPTAESVHPAVRRNTLMQSWRVADEAASRAILGYAGAEKLTGAQYLVYSSTAGGLQGGLAFAPKDEQIGNYLSDAHVRQVERPIFIDAPSRDLPMDEPADWEPPALDGDPIGQIVEQVRDAYLTQKASNRVNKSALARLAGLGSYSGGTVYKVNEAISRIDAEEA